MSNNNEKDLKNDYYFGGIEEFSLEEIEKEVLSESVYLDVFAGSDLRYKKNIEPLDQGLDTISKISPVKWEWMSDSHVDDKVSQGQEVGVIAQELSELLPELVRKNDKGFLHVNYAGLTPYLVNAIKELNLQVQELKEEIRELKK